MTVTVADPQRLDPKGKPVMYTGAFVEIYKWRNRRLVHETHGMAELEKYPTRAENSLNLGAHRSYKIPSILRSAHVVPRDNDGNVFYVNNYIDWDQFNQLYDPMWQTKGTRIANAISRKLTPASREAMEQRREAGEKAARIKKAMIDNRLAVKAAASRLVS